MSIFEVPEFITMPAVGIDISTDTVRFIEFKKNGDKFVVGRYASTPITAGVVQSGSVQDAIALSRIVSDMAKKYNLKLANVALPEEQSFLVQMDFPTVSRQDIRTMIELHLEEYVPISPSECVFDYTIIPSSSDGVTTVIACVFPEKIVEQYIEIFRGTGITPKSFELQSYSVARSIFPKNKIGTYMGIDIGKDITNIFIAKDNIVHFSAIIDMGGDNISREVARTLKISFNEADALKIKHGLIGDSEYENLRDAMSPVLDEMSSRIAKYFSYWASKNINEPQIGDIYLTGGGSNLRGFAEYLGQGVNAKVHVANPWINILDFEEYTPPIEMNISHGYAAAIGLAMKDI